MLSVIEPLLKTKNSIKFGWKSEFGAVTYKIYASLFNSASSMTLIYEDISSQVSKEPGSMGKVVYPVDIEDVRTALSLSSDYDFSNKVFFFTITYVDSSSTESSIDLSTIVEVPPVGIYSRYMRDDPSINRHIYLFSNEDQKWIKGLGNSSGAAITSESALYADNIVKEYTYDGTDISTLKVYSSDATVAGSPAKLTTYTYIGGFLTKSITTDSTV